MPRHDKLKSLSDTQKRFWFGIECQLTIFIQLAERNL